MKNLQQQISEKIEQATDILEKFGMPSAQLNDRTAYCLLALLNVTPEKSWENIENPLIGITPMMDFTKTNYKKEYAPNSRETFRRFSVHRWFRLESFYIILMTLRVLSTVQKQSIRFHLRLLM